jgi:hypothetical protein
MILSRFLFVSDDPLCFRLIQWKPAPAPAVNPTLTDDSSESYNYSLKNQVEKYLGPCVMSD